MKQEGGSMLEAKRHVKWMMKQGDEAYNETFVETCKREKMKSVQILCVISTVCRES
jgi:hypothetical protein